tara:strand:+ start:416 stop:694 length:279 start_codon:yes stop_codon:yes gene_type:complete
MKIKATAFAIALLPFFDAQADSNFNGTLHEAVTAARDLYPGRVLSVRTKKQNGQQLHSIKILTTDGHVRRYNTNSFRSEKKNFSKKIVPNNQ